MSQAEKPAVLVVDDNAETCTLLSALLQRDFLVEVASDGLHAVEKLKARKFGAILLDLRMPQHDGFSVLEFLRETQPDALRSVIVLTAMLHPRELERARAYKVCRIMAKPFDIDVLLTVVKECVNPDGYPMGGVFCSPMIILLADLLRRSIH